MQTPTVFEFSHDTTIVLQPTFSDFYVRKTLEDSVFFAVSGLRGNGLPDECYILEIKNTTDFAAVVILRLDNPEIACGWTMGEKYVL
jgi:hypothetical protein